MSEFFPPALAGDTPTLLTKEQVEKAVPPNLKNAVTQDFVDRLNAISNDEILAEQIRSNFVSYGSVLRDGKYKIEDYLNAVTYVSFKLMGMTNQEAYLRTFPQRHANLVARGADQKDISAYVAAFNKGKLVNSILEQTLVPSWVLNQDLYQKALNTQAKLMEESQSDLVRTQAANSLLTHLGKPKDAAILNIGMNESSGMRELKQMMLDAVERQREAIGNGVSARVIAEQKIIDVESEETN